MLVVRYGRYEALGTLHRVQPNVHYDPARTVITVFSGHLSNLDELMERYAAAQPGTYDSPTSVVPTGDMRQLAADIIHRAYLHNRSMDPFLLLSELQGQYAFAVYDSERKQVLAARDGSGREPLFYSIDEDGGLSLSNAPLTLPDTLMAGGHWEQLPPGHFIAGGCAFASACMGVHG